jgi:hypothetical protein
MEESSLKPLLEQVIHQQPVSSYYTSLTVTELKQKVAQIVSQLSSLFLTYILHYEG